MTPSDLDGIRKRCEAYGSDSVPDAFRDRQALLDEVEWLQTKLGHMEKHVAVNDEEYLVMKDVLRAEHQACQELRADVADLKATNDLLGREAMRHESAARDARARLALLEPVWEAAKSLRDAVMSGNLNHERDAKQALYDAIDAAVAKEGK